MSPGDAPRTATRGTEVTDARVAAAAVLADLRRGDLLDASFDRRTASLEPRDRADQPRVRADAMVGLERVGRLRARHGGRGGA